jgi:hypothetical protein
MMPGPTLMSRDNLASMSEDNVLPAGAENALEKVFGINPQALDVFVKRRYMLLVAPSEIICWDYQERILVTLLWVQHLNKCWLRDTPLLVKTSQFFYIPSHMPNTPWPELSEK